MILEHADIRILPGKHAEFEVAIQHGVESVIARSPGFQGYKVNRSMESPERYLLMIYWDTYDNHMVDFRQGPLFIEWRAIVGPFFAGPLTVEHFELVAKSS